MNRSEVGILEDLVAAHLDGEAPQVPVSLQSEFARAIAAHEALRGLIHETATCAADDSDERRPPDLSNEYEIEREIGRGGMGVVYLVYQRSLNRAVALKVLRPGEQTFGPLVKRFLGEAKHLARLRHPNIVSIHEIGDAHGEPYFTMDFIDGEPLSAEVRRGPMSPTQAVAILKQVGKAVQHAHRQGIIHRDLKPSNVLIDHEGTAVVTDFGLARDVSKSSDLTQTGELLGTPQYMSPEQARGQSSLVGESTDIHALGLLLFEMLTGRAAFASSSPADVLVRLLNEDPPPLRSLDRRIPRDLETICQKALQKSPAARYSSVSALLEDIRRFEAGEPLVARRPSVVRRMARLVQRHWKIATTVASTVVVTAVLAVLIAAPLFDKSFDELIAWGDEELARGNPNVAAQVYLRALHNATESEKLLSVDRIVKTCHSLDDPKAVVELAMQIIDVAPAKSFGRHDYLVAQALVSREYTRDNLGLVDVWDAKLEPVLQLVKTRLELALAGGLPEDQKLEAEQILTNVNLAISDGSYPVRYQPDYLHTMPPGDAAELQEILSNETTDPWSRGRAGIALGQLHEKERRRAEAITAYRQAYDLVRSVYPMYSGVKVSRGSGSLVNTPDAEECQLVRRLVDRLQQLDPPSIPQPKGRVEFEVVGYEFPATVHIALELKLGDPSIKNPNQGLPHNLPRLIPLQQSQVVGATVLDGTYRLHQQRSYHTRWDKVSDKIGRLLQVDTSDWPDEIEVRGHVVKLPPVRIRLAEAIELQSPASGEAVNLPDAELRWTALPNAKSYQVHLSVRKELPQPMSSMFLALDVDSARLKFVDIEDKYKRLVCENLVAGSTGAWRVDAYDAAGKCIGKALEERLFLVATQLSDP